MTITLQRFRKCEAGATAVEFGLIALPLIVVTLGTVEFGRALYTRNDMAQTLDRVERRLLIKEAGFTDQAIINALKDGKFTSASIGAIESVSGVSYRTATIIQDFQMLIPTHNVPFQIVVERRIHIPG